MSDVREIILLPMPFGFAAFVSACLMLGGCQTPAAMDPPEGLKQATGAAAALNENHGAIRWHLVRAQEELK